jgi:hypothetical protein
MLSSDGRRYHLHGDQAAYLHAQRLFLKRDETFAEDDVEPDSRADGMGPGKV